MWETLTSERLFDGKTDIEIFKKIRACKVPPLTQYRDDLPAALIAVLDVALAAEPANRYVSADEFAQALGQVMKQAVGVNSASALGAAVVAARTVDPNASLNQMPTQDNVVVDSLVTTAPHLRPRHDSVDVEFSTTDQPVDLKKK
jgi:hypothetical protein